MSQKPCTDRLEFRVGRDGDGKPCLDVFSRGGILPVGYITQQQLREVLIGADRKSELQLRRID